MTASFKPGWKISLFVVLLLPVLLSLGNWQLNRADEKQRLLTAQADLMAKAPERLSIKPFPNYMPVVLVGRFDTAKYFLLDNQVVDGIVGYDVLSLFYDDSGITVLVNRGWVQGDYDRSNLPNVKTPDKTLMLSGSIGRNLGQPFLLSAERNTDSWPQVLQSIDLSFIGQAAGVELPDYFVRLDYGSNASYKVHYQAINVSPQKHQAYAFQWFAMSVALLILYLLLGFGKLSPTKESEN